MAVDDAAGDPRRAELRALLDRFDGACDANDAPLQKTLLGQATALVDRARDPVLWAFLRHLLGMRSEVDDPATAIAAYEDALTVYGPASEDRTTWLLCEGGLGAVLARTESPGTPGGERAIEHLERAVDAQPEWYAELLGSLYAWRTVGDPLANWERQVALLDVAAVHAAAGSAAAERIALARNAALATRPGADFAVAIERSLEAHRETLGTLPRGSAAHAETALELATAWLDRVAGDRAANAREAESLLQAAWRGCTERGDGVRAARAALLLARIRTHRHDRSGGSAASDAVAAAGAADATREADTAAADATKTAAEAAHATRSTDTAATRAIDATPATDIDADPTSSGSLGFAGLHEAIDWCVRGREAARAAGEGALVASAEKSIALARLALLRQGDAASLEPAVDAARAAAAAFALSPAHADELRKVLQIEADAWLAADRPADAVAPLERAVEHVRAALAHATSRAGRLELAWRVRDSASLLAWCHATCGEAQRACAALESGRGLLWGADAAWSGEWNAIVPGGGAVVVSTFAGPTGMAVVATRASGTVVLDVVPLPDAGADAMRALVAGPEAATRLGGWLEAWCFRTSAPERFEGAIAAVAVELHRRVAAPVVACLDARGVAEGAEVVWLPQGASSVLPLQAAAPSAGGRGLVDRVALRFAPSLASLERPAATDARGRPVAIVDPTGDLPFAPLEARWLAEVEPAIEILAGAEATADALLGRLARRPSLLHVAGHGAFDLDDPFRSSLVLAGGERLPLETLLPRLARDGAPALAVLSACETSVARVTAWADELLGFPAALLAHGVGGVVGSLWTVADAQTALLMRVFHARRLGRGPAAGAGDGALGANDPMAAGLGATAETGRAPGSTEPDPGAVATAAGGATAAALRDAQRWLRDASRDDLAALFEPLRAEPAPIGPLAAATLEALAAFDDRTPPFAHPVHWAGFALWGRG